MPQVQLPLHLDLSISVSRRRNLVRDSEGSIWTRCRVSTHVFTIIRWKRTTVFNADCGDQGQVCVILTVYVSFFVHQSDLTISSCFKLASTHLQAILAALFLDRTFARCCRVTLGTARVGRRCVDAKCHRIKAQFALAANDAPVPWSWSPEISHLMRCP